MGVLVASDGDQSYIGLTESENTRICNLNFTSDDAGRCPLTVARVELYLRAGGLNQQLDWRVLPLPNCRRRSGCSHWIANRLVSDLADSAEGLVSRG